MLRLRVTLGACAFVLAACAMPAREGGTNRSADAPPAAASAQRPTLLATYLERAAAVNAASDAQWPMLAQRLAFVEAALGLYHEAVRHFPLNETTRIAGSLPDATTHRAVEARDVVAELAARHRLVLVNEAHHDVATRRLTLDLLPRLRAIGFTHFAVEALNGEDRGLQRRGHALATSGYYINEPLFGEIIREALRLGYTLVEYEYRGSDRNPQAREDAQARNLMRAVFDVEANARLFVHAGYAHIDKAHGRLGGTEPMAMRLAALSGIDALSVDQTELRSAGSARETATVSALIDAFMPAQPVVLLAIADARPWSANPRAHDVSVLLPRPALDAARPAWLDLEGRRKPWPITIEACGTVRPCSIGAHALGDVEGAVAADRYAFVDSIRETALYLRPGRYRLLVTDSSGQALARPRTITVR